MHNTDHEPTFAEVRELLDNEQLIWSFSKYWEWHFPGGLLRFKRFDFEGRYTVAEYEEEKAELERWLIGPPD